MNNIGWYSRHGKRYFDLGMAVAGLVVLSPLLIVIAIAQLLIEGRPILFSQERTGQHGTSFRIIKFRTMTTKISTEAEFSAGDRSRVTKLGAFLRRSKLDELPQLYCVLKGDMSLVGPRPEIAKWTRVYPEKWKKIHTIRPGITDPIALALLDEELILENSDNPDDTYRDDILPMKIECYIDYASNIKFTQDINILFKTVKSILSQ